MVFDLICAYVKENREIKPMQGRSSVRIQVSHDGRGFRFIVAKEKWINELFELDAPTSGGCIDFVHHLTGASFVEAVRIFLGSAQVSSPQKSLILGAKI